MQAIFQGLLQSGEQQVENQMEKCFSVKEDTSFGRLNYYQNINVKVNKTLSNSALDLTLMLEC
jgi:hypothetical protein